MAWTRMRTSANKGYLGLLLHASEGRCSGVLEAYLKWLAKLIDKCNQKLAFQGV